MQGARPDALEAAQIDATMPADAQKNYAADEGITGYAGLDLLAR